MSLELLITLRARGVQLWAEGDTLMYDAPVGVMTDGLKDQLRRRKTEVLRLLMVDDSVAGLDITAEQYRAWLDADDIVDIEAGRIPVKTLRAYAEIAAKEC